MKEEVRRLCFEATVANDEYVRGKIKSFRKGELSRVLNEIVDRDRLGQAASQQQ